VTEPWDEAEIERPRLGRVAPVRVRVPAKINLHLQVGDLRPDGYHELATVYHAVSLFDEVTARPGDTLTLTMEGEGAGSLSLDESNLVLRAARLLAVHTGRPAHARIHLRKHIPIAGGLAGGSADAAAALVACDALWQTGLSRSELAGLAAALGSDVPFSLVGGTALGTGRGEVLTPVLARGRFHWVVAIADGGLSTPEVYAECDRLRGGIPVPEPRVADALMAALRTGDADALGAALHNDLQEAACSLRPPLLETLETGVQAGALGSLVSGSGPSVVFLARSPEHAIDIAVALSATGTCRSVRRAHGPVAGARVVGDG
jgi:4-diphosphocytidyl-2-C-methyl-D-erythritol kinase